MNDEQNEARKESQAHGEGEAPREKHGPMRQKREMTRPANTEEKKEWMKGQGKTDGSQGPRDGPTKTKEQTQAPQDTPTMNEIWNG